MGCPSPGSSITVIHVQDVDLLHPFFSDEVDLEASVEVLVGRILLIVTVF